MKAIEKIAKLSMHWGELKDLPKDQLALFAIANFAATEVNMLRRLYIQSSHPLTGEEDVDVLIFAQRHMLLRIWSSKLFEFLDVVEDVASRYSVSNQSDRFDQKTAMLLSEAKQSFDALKEHSGYSLTRSVRHEATNHYPLNAVKKNLDSVPDHANCSFYLHEMDGNSYYPMGEEVVFIGRLNRHGRNLQTKEAKANLLDEWMEWNFEANTWLTHFHTQIYTAFVKPITKDRYAHEKLMWLEPGLVGDIDPPSIPLFLRRSQRS